LNILYRIKKQVEGIDTSRSCLLRVGGYVGWLFTTGSWAIEDGVLSDKDWFELKKSLRKYGYERLDFPKSRKMDAEGTPFGFVQLTLL
jgi:hypothetical protein